MHAGITEDPITQAIQQEDAHLVEMAMGLCELYPAHLQMAQSISCHQARLLICRLLVRRGVDPHQGSPSAIDRASSQGLEDEAWSMTAAWLDFQSLTRTQTGLFPD